METDKNGNSVFRLYNEKFFPVDGRGFGAEGQRDGYTNALRNYGYIYLLSTARSFILVSLSFFYFDVCVPNCCES